MKGALIGCGFFAQNHLHAWRDIDGVEIVALCDTDENSLQTTAQAFDITRTYKDAAKMLAEGGFDFVDIATTVSSHRALVGMAAKAGAHIICQKPFADNLEDAREMVNSARAGGKTLMVHAKTNISRDVSPTLLPWAEKPWHNIQESVLSIQQHFVKCILNGVEPQTSGADNLKTLALVEAAYQSAESGRTVSLSDV